jgi:hypothetical protein
MKELLQKIWGGIKSLWTKANDLTKTYAEISVHIVEATKNFNDSDAADFLEFVVTTAIPGDVDNKVAKVVRKFIREKFPVILVELKIIQSIADLQNDNDKLKAILNELNLSSVNGIIYKGVAGKALEFMADGKFDFNDACDLTGYYFKLLQASKANGTSEG